mgnify:CR=1 FL=1
MRVLGLSLGHDTNFSIVENGEVISVHEVERYFRQKRYKLHSIYDDNEIHKSGFQYVKRDDLIDQLNLIKSNFGVKFDAIALQNQGNIDEYHNLLITLKKSGFLFQKSDLYNHHLCHAASSFYTSPFQDSLILSYDGTGNDGYTVLFNYEPQNGLKYIYKNNIKFGQSYNNFGFILGVKPDVAGSTAGKLMGLTAYGEVIKEWMPYAVNYVNNYKKYPQNPSDTLSDYGKGHIINSSYLQEIPELKNYLIPYKEKPNSLRHKIKFLFSNKHLFMPELTDRNTQNLAKTFQAAWTECVIKLLEQFQETNKNLCIVGGCALNGITNFEINKRLKFEKIHYIPNPSDCGLSVGAALNSYYSNSKIVFKGYKTFYSPYLGLKTFDYEKDLNVSKDLTCTKINLKEFLPSLANIILDDKIVGLINDRYEIGPRALGNRSILCNPLNVKMKEILNEKVKHREWYRPFAPVCSEEDAQKYFTNLAPIFYMSEICYTKEKYRKILPSITHVDGSCRLQTVNNNQNLILWSLLKEFEKISGFPILINTSFNPGGEPILNYSQIGLDMLVETDLDFVIINDKLFSKKSDNSYIKSILK